jgi:hypothetical protein
MNLRPLLAALPLLFSAACGDDPDVVQCCECLANTDPDGEATTDVAATCFVEDDTGGSIDDSVEECTMEGLPGKVLGYDAVDFDVVNQGCIRVACQADCQALLDKDANFKGPPQSAGTLSAVLDGTPFEALNVVLSVQDPEGDEQYFVTVTGEDNLDFQSSGTGQISLFANLVTGPATFAVAPFTDYGIGTDLGPGGGGAESGTIELTVFDDERIEGTFEATMDLDGVAGNDGGTWALTDGQFAVERALSVENTQASQD